MWGIQVQFRVPVRRVDVEGCYKVRAMCRFRSWYCYNCRGCCCFILADLGIIFVLSSFFLERLLVPQIQVHFVPARLNDFPHDRWRVQAEELGAVPAFQTGEADAL